LENHFEDHGDHDDHHDHGEVFGGSLGAVLDHGSAEECIAAIGMFWSILCRNWL